MSFLEEPETRLLLAATLLVGAAVVAVQLYMCAPAAAGQDVAPRARARAGSRTEEAGSAPTSSRVDEMSALLKDQVLVDPSDPDPHTSDVAIRRFLRAVGGEDVKSAAQRLVDTARWRYENRPWTWSCSFCAATPGHHTWRQVAVDKRGRPVVYSCMAQAATHRYTAACAVQHLVFAIEQAVRTMPEGEDGWLWICDFSGFSLRAVDTSTASGVIRVVSEYYPERLAKVIVVNAPSLFVPAWRALRLLVDPRTTSKVAFVSSHTETRKVLHEILPADDADWVMAELTVNLQRPLPFAQSCDGFWRPPAPGVEHDPRGARSYVERYLAGGEGPQLHQPHPNIALHLAGEYDGEAGAARNSAQSQAQSD